MWMAQRRRHELAVKEYTSSTEYVMLIVLAILRFSIGCLHETGTDRATEL